MKSIFVDCNNQLAPVFARVLRPRRSADHGQQRAVPVGRPAAIARGIRQLPRRPFLYADRNHGQCRRLEHIVFLGTGASSYMDVPALARSASRSNHQGLWRIAVAEHAMALISPAAASLRHGPRDTRRPLTLEGMQLKGKTLGLVGLGGIGTRSPGSRRHRHGGDRLEPHAARRRRRPLVELDSCWRPPTSSRCTSALNDETRGLGRRPPARADQARRDPGQHRARRLIDEAALIDALRSGQSAMPGSTFFTPNR